MWGRKLETAGALMLAALLAGCGGGYSKSDFVARANAICAGAVRQIRAIGPAAPGGELAAYLAQVLPVVEAEETQLRALKRPSGSAGDRATLDRFYSALGQVVEDYRELAAAARLGNLQGVADVEAALRASPVSSLAASYGLSSCGTAGSTSVSTRS